MIFKNYWQATLSLSRPERKSSPFKFRNIRDLKREVSPFKFRNNRDLVREVKCLEFKISINMDES